uniref:SAM domain-containing protein n=2 Tax=Anopheles atroparvus TaxID=41427 RepID=A0AAG5D3A2_ANOAO
MENDPARQNNGKPPSAASSSVLASSSTPSPASVQLHSSSSPRSRCHPVICDVMRLETIRERNSVYSEDGEFIDLPLPPVPQSANTATDSTASDCDERAMEYQRQMPGVTVQAEAYLQSRLREFEEEDGPIGNGYIGEGDCVEEIILAPSVDDSVSASGVTYCDQPATMRSTLDGRVVEEDLKSIDSNTSNTLRKSAWSVVSTGSTGDGCSNGEDYESRFSEGDDSVDDDNLAEEDDYGERSSGYREKSPFLRSISLSPVERRYRKQSLASRERRRKSASSSGTHASAVGGNWNYKHADKHSADDSTCCDDDFTWVHAQSRSEAPKASVESDRRSSSQATTSRSVPHEQRGQIMPPQHQPQRQVTRSSTSTASGAVASGKPPRPMRDTGSLDRRRNLATSRHERDCKSRSTHSLKEKSSSSEFHKHDSLSSNLSLNAKDQLHDSGSFNNYNSSGSSSLHQQQLQSQHNPRRSPSIWEPPPPPPLSLWDPHYYWSYPHYHHQHQSREELRLIDYHRRQQELYQYGSNSALGSTQDLSCSSGCCNRGFYPTPFPPPPGACCPYEHRPQCAKELQRQDTDERLRRLQTDKEALAMQVKTLTEQVQTQSSKIIELERTVKEKNQLLSNAEDLLQREMLSRSSLETQKLELMSAMSELKLQQAALERENLELRTNFVTSTGGLMNGSLTSGSNGSGSALTNALNNNSITTGLLRRPQIITNTRMVGMSASTPGNSLNSSPMHHGSHGSLPLTAVSPITPKTPPATYRQRIDVHYSSLPRQAFATTLSTVSTSSGSSTATDSNANPKRNVAFAETENGNEDRSEGVPPTRSYTPQPSPSPSMSNKLKNIFGKIKRSNSGTLEDLTGADSEFKRGGIRATAGPRLGWSGTAPYRRPDKPFREWNLDTVCQWFDHLGLSMYEEELSRWLKSSTAPAVELMKASPVDIEKELNLRNPLHRKKIVLAVADVSGSEDEDELFKSAGLLDTSWILRWLDDIGMPQYKEPFTVARMDGRMLHKLTFDDLTLLQMSSCLHVASIRRGIQLMRHEKWHPDCLVRRPLPPDTSTKDDVRLWSSQRVHEWLRAVDLAEYSPNLRGSGVHGALMIYEVKFTAELFADLLNIPASKTLLRRHLATHFKELLGRDIIQVKREAENTLGFQPLTISSKIKTPKKSQFSLKRKKSAKGGQLGEEWSDFVCPMGGSDDEKSLNGTNCLPRQHHQQQHQHNYFRSRVGACFTSSTAVE